MNQIRELLSTQRDKETVDGELCAKTLTTLNYPAHLLLLAGSFCLGVNSRDNNRAQHTHYTVSSLGYDTHYDTHEVQFSLLQKAWASKYVFPLIIQILSSPGLKAQKVSL